MNASSSMLRHKNNINFNEIVVGVEKKMPTNLVYNVK